MAGIQFGGLASGLDTGTIIEQLMSVERAPRSRIELRQTAVQARQDALKDIVSKLRTLKLASADLRSVTLWQSQQKITNSDATKFDATVTGSVTPGSYSVEVTSLATSAQRTFAYAAQSADTTWTINGTDVTVAANATLDEAVASVNATASVGVRAANVGGNLVFTDVDTGAASSVTATGAGLTEDTTLSKPGTDASVTVGGTATTSATNVIETAIGGLSLTVKTLGTSVLDVSPASVNKDAIVGKVKAFVEAYNAANDAMRLRLGEKKVVNPQTGADARKGVLFGDSAVSSAASALRLAAQDPVAGADPLFDTLAELGITFAPVSGTANADANTGKLTFDETKFRAALDTNLPAVQRALGGEANFNGLAQRFEGFINPLVSGGGGIDGKATAAGDELARLKKSLDRFDERMERKEDRLRRQFTALEQALAANQARQADLFSKLG